VLASGRGAPSRGGSEPGRPLQTQPSSCHKQPTKWPDAAAAKTEPRRHGWHAAVGQGPKCHAALALTAARARGAPSGATGSGKRASQPWM
jgi:hypothetical protein